MPPQTLSTDAMAVLRAAAATSDSVDISAAGTLDGRLYREVNEALERLGGKWNKRRRVHVFDTDPREALADLLGSGATPVRNPDAFYATPAPVRDLMLTTVEQRSAGVDGPWLDPSCGNGALLDAAASWLERRGKHVGTFGIEIDPVRAAECAEKGHEVIVADFLSVSADPSYAVVLMNPPFSLPRQPRAWVDHLMHAMRFMAREGILVCVCPASLTYLDTSEVKWLREQASSIEALPPASFSAEGTNAKTVLAVYT